MNLFRLFSFISLLLISLTPCSAQVTEGDTLPVQAVPRISLVTAAPGPEVYELYGHQAVRVQMPDGRDMIYNYGLFDFNEPNFIYRFVKGETDYKGGVSSTNFFLSDYEERGSQVTEQELNLTPEEAVRMAQLLEESVKPENATYRYKYCTDNCSVRILNIMEEALGSNPQYPNLHPELLTYRKTMRHYDYTYPWYALGVDMALGSEIDRPITPRQRMFVPMELLEIARATKLADGRPLVKSEQILVEGRGDMTLPPTPFLLSPLFWAWILLLFNLLVVYQGMRYGWGPWRWWLTIWFSLTGLAGLLSMFLIFISIHEATSPNILGWWLNPLWLIAACSLWVKQWQRFNKAFFSFLSVICGAMLLAWGFGAQYNNVALMLFCVSTLALSASFALTGATLKRVKSTDSKE